jgi:serine/threonine protein kinase
VNIISLEYASPESLPSPETGRLQQVDSKADMWSLGMILHKLLFFRLPYRYASDADAQDNGKAAADLENGEKLQRLENEVLNYSGLVNSQLFLRNGIESSWVDRFRSTPALVNIFESRRLPRAFLVLLESLLNVSPSGRPSCERVSSAIRDGRVCLLCHIGDFSIVSWMMRDILRKEGC